MLCTHLTVYALNSYEEQLVQQKWNSSCDHYLPQHT